ncbi:MAG: C2 family cysteine protease [Tepidisphaeraceae bacterium]
MKGSTKQLGSKRQQTFSAVATAARSIVMENLESRQLMSGTPFIELIPQNDGSEMLYVQAPAHTHDTITVTEPMYGMLQVFDDGVSQGEYLADELEIYAVQGAKEIDVDSSVTMNATVVGGVGSDTILGGSGYNYIDQSHKGNSLLVDGDDENWIVGGLGQDSIVAMSGDDTVFSGTGGSDIWVNGENDSDGYDYIDNQGLGVQQEVYSFQGYYGFDDNGNLVYEQPSLGRDGTSLTLPEPGTFTQNEPNGASGWTNISSLPLFGANGPEIQDINQNNLGDCYFLSTLGSIAWLDPNQIRNNITPLGDGTYAVQFTINGQSEYFRVDGNLPIAPDGSGLDYNQYTDADDDAIWACIYEKAFAIARPNPDSDSTDMDYANFGNIESGNPAEVFSDFGDANWSYTPDDYTAEQLLTSIASWRDNGMAVGIVTDSDNGADMDSAGLYTSHVYSVLGVTTDSSGDPELELRNPWGLVGPDASTDGIVYLPISNIVPGTFSSVVCSYV